jgi:hypothetical protein
LAGFLRLVILSPPIEIPAATAVTHLQATAGITAKTGRLPKILFRNFATARWLLLTFYGEEQPVGVAATPGRMP